ncbi:MAG: hypothetical protein WCJ35_28400 [Planctomycetota bacterium]
MGSGGKRRVATRLVQAAAGGHAGLLGQVHSACTQAKAAAWWCGPWEAGSKEPSPPF